MKRAGAALAIALALAVVLGLCVRQWIVGTTRVAGSSMRETLCDGDVALVARYDRLTGRPTARGDVVECRFPGREDTYVKRVIGLPGDEIAFSGGTLTVNGQAVSEPYVTSPTDDYAVSLGPDEYLAMGDNREGSYDSRMADMGMLGAEDILGRVRCVIWPPERIGPVR